jgi:hypothetical protein
LRYIAGAYSTYAAGKAPPGQPTWLASVCVFAGDPIWDGQILRVSDAFIVIGWGGQYYVTQGAAEQAADGQAYQTELAVGAQLTLVTVDAQNAYRDNSGADVQIEIWYVPR